LRSPPKADTNFSRQPLRNNANACFLSHARRERYAVTARKNALNTELSGPPCASITQLPRQDANALGFGPCTSGSLRRNEADELRPRGVMRSDTGKNWLAIRLADFDGGTGAVPVKGTNYRSILEIIA
jgi:hypothetical protein